jgi:hypothetical protein
MYVFVCLLVLLPFQALGASLIIPTEPHRGEIERVKYYTIAYGLHQAPSGEFQLYTNVRYRHISSRIQHSEHFMFPLQRGTIIKRDPRTLVLRLEDREVVVGKHRWWYAPYWQAADDVDITCDHDKRFKTVVVENCRLTIEAPPVKNAFLPP